MIVIQPREAVIDAEGLNELANLGSMQAKKISTTKDMVRYLSLIN